MLGRAGLNVTTNGTLSDSCLVDVLRAWLLDWNKAYFVYFLLAETVFRDWSKSIGGGGPEHLEMWLIKNT